jgi:phage tail protein X
MPFTNRETLDMPNDAKLGLIVGMGLVITVAVVFFRKEPLNAHVIREDRPSPAASAAPAGTGGERGALRGIPAKKAAHVKQPTEDRRHTVQEGDTLFGLALHYYGDSDKFVEIYQANRGVLKIPDHLPPGTVLTIPLLPAGGGNSED